MGWFDWIFRPWRRRRWYFFDAWSRENGDWRLLHQLEERMTPDEADAELMEALLDYEHGDNVIRRFAWDSGQDLYVRDA